MDAITESGLKLAASGAPSRTLANFTEVVRVPASVMTADNGVSETPDGFYREFPRFTRVEG